MPKEYKKGRRHSKGLRSSPYATKKSDDGMDVEEEEVAVETVAEVRAVVYSNSNCL